MERTRHCKYCGKEFSYEVGRGKDRMYCQPICSLIAYEQKRDSEIINLPECSTTGCYKKANRKGAGLCEACYVRKRRTGTVRPRKVEIAPYKFMQSAGYVWLREPDHPLVNTQGLIYEHRFVYYNEHGDGPFKCHWCGKSICWDDMDIDHLDEDKTNNNINNLVASCPPCNRERGRWRAIQSHRKKGIQITHNGESKTAGQWADDMGLSRGALSWRLEHWPIEIALTKEKGNTGPIRSDLAIKSVERRKKAMLKSDGGG